MDPDKHSEHSGPTHGRRAFLVGALATAALAACSGSGSGDASDATPAGGDDGGATTAAGDDASSPPPFDRRVLLLGEEYLLADALALGVVPVASTATVPEVGFIGVDDYDTSGIEVLSNTDSDLEDLVVLDTDLVVAAQYVVDALGADALEPFGELVVVPDGSTTVEVLDILAATFGREEQAEVLEAELAEAEARAAAEIPDQEVSVVAIYPGPSVAVFVDGPWAVPDVLLDAGVTLVPDSSMAHDENGRVYLSLENLDVVAGPKVIVLTNESVEGESAAIAEITDDPLWTELPGPAAGEVYEIDRLGYPGVEGRIRLVDELISTLGSP